MGTVISKDGTPIAFDNYGAGPPVVLVGGAFQYRAFDPRTAELARLLSARFRVFHYDRRGRGGSGDTAPHSVQREVEDLQTIIAGAGGPASVFGMSSGAVLALEAAARGTPITRLALYEAPFIVDDSRPPFPPDYLAQLNKFLALGRRGGAVRFWLRMVGVPAPVVALMRCTPAWPKFKAVAHTLPYDAAIMADTLGGVPLPAGRWTSVRVPALTVTGGKSPAWLHHGMQALTNILPRAENRILEGQTHMVKPEALAPVLEEFFSAGCGPAGETRHTQP